MRVCIAVAVAILLAVGCSTVEQVPVYRQVICPDIAPALDCPIPVSGERKTPAELYASWLECRELAALWQRLHDQCVAKHSDELEKTPSDGITR